MKILFIQTGGTIDKDYPTGDNHHGYNFEIGIPAYERILARVNPSFEYETKQVIQKDSLDLTDEDRNELYRVCKGSSVDRIIITHGTDTLVRNAEVLSGVTDKTIVLTGAMVPERFKDSDADFNLGVAVGAMSSLENGVYIAMGGQVMRWDQVGFDADTGQFKPIGSG